MLRGHHHVLHAGAPGQLGPRARSIRYRLELRRQLFIFGDGNAFILHHPLVTPERAVEAPVNEHAELRFVPPFHAPLAIFDRRGRRRARVGRSGLLTKHQITLRGSGQSTGRGTHQRQVVSSVHSYFPFLEGQPQSKLVLPRRLALRETRNLSDTGSYSSPAGIYGHVRGTFPRLDVENVEGLNPKLQLEAFTERYGLERGEINVIYRRS